MQGGEAKSFGPQVNGSVPDLTCNCRFTYLLLCFLHEIACEQGFVDGWILVRDGCGFIFLFDVLLMGFLQVVADGGWFDPIGGDLVS